MDGEVKTGEVSLRTLEVGNLVLERELGREKHNSKNTCTSGFFTALLTIAKTW